MDEYLAFAKDLASHGGKLIKDNFESSLNIELKSDRSPVTEVDKAINDLVIESIQAIFPDHGLLGEEADLGDGTEEFQWICDPLDGTKAFIIGLPQSTFILALTQRGTPLLSVVYDPYADNLYYAVKGGGAFCNDQPIYVSQALISDGGYVLLSGSSFECYPYLLERGAQVEPVTCSGYRCLILAKGRASGIIQREADFHDVGAAALLIEEAGGKVTDYDGNPIAYDKPITNGIILSNTACHQELLDIVKK